MEKSLISIFILVSYLVLGQTDTQLFSTVSTHDITVIVNEIETFDIFIFGINNTGLNITLKRQHPDLIEVSPDEIIILPNEDDTIKKFDQLISVKGINPGLLEITAEFSPNIDSASDIYVRVTVALSSVIIYISSIIGWLYFVAWSASFYPQIYDNYRRHSVIGLNFDYLSFNIVGSALYSAFNGGLIWSQMLEDEYFARNPRGLNPVLINDVLFSLHALFACGITAVQCIFYERADQRISNCALIILGIFLTLVVTFASLAGYEKIHWLDFLYYCSYIKLTITLIKYIPQAVMNYRRKSTVGWSIGCIFLDIIGGVFSIMQMILNAYNHNDWASIFGDPTKFGLGLFSICFDIFFIIQHYVLYRVPRTGLRENDSNLDKLLTEKA